ncbi:MAG: hypothetical protein HC806_03350 [Anaerolineae bacterium]|nr:hypothetical protein [Anaerolineae bacterium]
MDHVGVFVENLELLERATAVLISNWTPATSLPSPVLGIPEGAYLEHAEREGLEHFREVVRYLSSVGFKVITVPALADFEDIYQHHNTIVAYDAARVHEKWLAEFGNLYHTKTKELVQRGQTISNNQFQASLSSRLQTRQHLTDLMQTNGIDLWISPSAPGPAPLGLESTGNPVMNLPWTHAGLPTLTLPAGKSKNGLPLGLQLTADWYGDEKLLGWAKTLQSSLSEWSPSS